MSAASAGDGDDDSTLGLSQVSTSTSHKKLDLAAAMMELTKELAYSINRVHDKDQQKLFLGAVVKLTEVAKGNSSLLEGQTLEALLESQLSLFTRNGSSQPMFVDADKVNLGMRRAAMPDRSKHRLKSRNELVCNGMKNSNKKEASCSLCHLHNHKAGPRCPVVVNYKSRFVAVKDSREYAKTLGNPAVHEVLTASAKDRGPMKEWFSEGCDIPFTAHHLVVRRCFYTAQQGESFQAVTLLQQGGAVLDNHEVCYFPAFKVASWIERYCVGRHRKKHLLSCLAEAQACYSQQVYDYSPGQSK
jgi:hypothetical protein